MEKSSQVQMPIRGTICTLKFSYIFLAKHLCVTFDATDFANILEVSRYETLRTMRFSAAMEVERNGAKEEIAINFPDVILDSTADELRNNRHLYRRLYYMPRES